MFPSTYKSLRLSVGGTTHAVWVLLGGVWLMGYHRLIYGMHFSSHQVSEQAELLLDMAGYNLSQALVM